MKYKFWRGMLAATGVLAAGYLAFVLGAAAGARVFASTRGPTSGEGEQYGQSGSAPQLQGQISNQAPRWCGMGGSPVQDVCAVSGGPELPFQAGCYASSQALGVVESIGLSAGVAQGAPQSGSAALAQCNWKQVRGNAWALAAQAIDKCVPLALELYDLHQQENQLGEEAAGQEGPETREELARREQEIQALQGRIYTLSVGFEACFGGASKTIACGYERKGHFFLPAFAGPCPPAPPPELYQTEAEDPYEEGNPPPSPPPPVVKDTETPMCGYHFGQGHCSGADSVAYQKSEIPLTGPERTGLLMENKVWFNQGKDYTCSVAAARMIFYAETGKEYPENQLEKELTDYIIPMLSGRHYQSGEGFTLDEIVSLLRGGGVGAQVRNFAVNTQDPIGALAQSANQYPVIAKLAFSECYGPPGFQIQHDGIYHAVVVVKVEGSYPDRLVWVMDPSLPGISLAGPKAGIYKMPETEFLKAWASNVGSGQGSGAASRWAIVTSGPAGSNPR